MARSRGTARAVGIAAAAVVATGTAMLIGPVAASAAPGDTTGGFVVSAEVLDPDGLIPAGTDLGAVYSVDGGPPIPLPLVAGGTARVDGVPVGATVTFAQSPPAITDGVWRAPDWSASSIVVGEPMWLEPECVVVDLQELFWAAELLLAEVPRWDGDPDRFVGIEVTTAVSAEISGEATGVAGDEPGPGTIEWTYDFDLETALELDAGDEQVLPFQEVFALAIVETGIEPGVSISVADSDHVVLPSFTSADAAQWAGGGAAVGYRIADFHLTSSMSGENADFVVAEESVSVETCWRYEVLSGNETQVQLSVGIDRSGLPPTGTQPPVVAAAAVLGVGLLMLVAVGGVRRTRRANDVG